MILDVTRGERSSFSRKLKAILARSVAAIVIVNNHLASVREAYFTLVRGDRSSIGAM